MTSAGTHTLADDLDATPGAVTAHGGRLITGLAHAQARPGVTLAYITDPEGNLIEVIVADDGSIEP